ncbi:DUF1353 domain-containing protein [Herbaspirillum sp. SJZ107]|uniref:DUF1353 domain-containing protein n=1 Tax=Herbaspirillum sp. SJZ107 TaxID=2572881 RepID=UPI001170CA38|nr:DUF1353 domain-containing protein [Herbaspirillum sp. SJZ107]TQK10709.1 uncharacterized protein DUF1353 [Herbaspirillum sp. SJZ107]
MVNRRNAIKAFGVGSAAFSLERQAIANEAGGGVYSDREAADRFMREWMTKEGVRSTDSDTPGKSMSPVMKTPKGQLIVGRFADRMYYTTALMGWAPSNAAQMRSYAPVVVPIGFVTDFASIPRVLWSLLPSDGPYVYAAVVHDYLYWEQHLPRETADNIFKFLMQDFEVDVATLSTIYGGVRVGGWAAWDENSRRKAAGEKRILRKPPDDPKARWADIKHQADYF